MAASVTLTASFPGSHVAKPGVLMLGNPQVEATVTSAAAFPGTANLVLTPDARNRLLLIQSDASIAVVAITANQVPGDVVPITVRGQTGTLTSYSCVIPGDIVGVYVKDA